MIRYEWDAETVRDEDVDDHFHADTFREVYSFTAPAGTTRALVLVRDDDNGRSWAYVNEDLTLPEYFEDAHGRHIARVPKKFHTEISKITR